MLMMWTQLLFPLILEGGVGKHLKVLLKNKCICLQWCTYTCFRITWYISFVTVSTCCFYRSWFYYILSALADWRKDYLNSEFIISTFLDFSKIFAFLFFARQISFYEKKKKNIVLLSVEFDDLDKFLPNSCLNFG